MYVQRKICYNIIVYSKTQFNEKSLVPSMYNELSTFVNLWFRLIHSLTKLYNSFKWTNWSRKEIGYFYLHNYYKHSSEIETANVIIFLYVRTGYIITCTYLVCLTRKVDEQYLWKYIQLINYLSKQNLLFKLKNNT